MADETGIQSVERLPVDVLRWQELAVDAGTAGTLDEVVRRVGNAFEDCLANTPENCLCRCGSHFTARRRRMASCSGWKRSSARKSWPRPRT